MLIIRPATVADIPTLREIMRLAIDHLQTSFLSPQQIAASHAIMGLDTQLIADGTYFVAILDGATVGCGGWSRRATLYGGDHTSSTRNAALLDPATEPARIRAMYTRPGFERRGVGRAILNASEHAAAAAGFRSAELMSTLSGEPLYLAAGYTCVERLANEVPLIRMRKQQLI